MGYVLWPLQKAKAPPCMTPEFIPLFGSPTPSGGTEGSWAWKLEEGMEAEGAPVLTGEEAARVARLVDKSLQKRLTVWLETRKRLLGILLGIDAAHVSIAHNAEGRPFLPAHPGHHISLSDSGNWGAVAVSHTRPVGIDVEPIRAMEWAPMLSMISEAEEASEIRHAAGEAAVPLAFFRCWAAKEAVLKAEGRGMRADARRVRLPAAFIRGDTDELSLSKDGAGYRLRIAETGHAVIARALRV